MLVLVLLKPSLKDFEWNLIAELPQDWETETLGGHKQNPVHTRTQEKGAVTPQETEPDLPVSVLESLAEAWVDSSLLCGQCTKFISLFEGGRHYLHYLLHSLDSGQTTGREHSPAHQQKIGLKIY